jgi:hypothetical protein
MDHVHTQDWGGMDGGCGVSATMTENYSSNQNLPLSIHNQYVKDGAKSSAQWMHSCNDQIN